VQVRFLSSCFLLCPVGVRIAYLYYLNLRRACCDPRSRSIHVKKCRRAGSNPARGFHFMSL